ncbi:MAG TPA: FGGY family carbohydrate kinase [Lacisediminihabitans sp.]|uniref:FGGY family carbohydrate kinase n=1 Tax=Lacisediminihabitans sp. TaxID=2787631 RepID=UPI002ED8395A
MTTIVAGIDSSTQSTKIVRIDAETGQLLGTTSAPHPEGTAVNPERWWDAFQAAGGGDLGDVAALAVSAQQHGMVALDAADAPVFDALLWNDTRSAPQAARLADELGRDTWAREIGVVPVASFTITKLAWLAEAHPELAAKVARVLLPHDWLTWRILGASADPTTDRSDASGTGYFSVPEGRYRTDLLELALGHAAQLPTVLGPAEIAGRTAAGAVVGVGAGDNAGAALGLGLRPGEVAVSIGTSATVFTSTETQIVDPSGAIAGFADATGRQLPLLAMLNGARTLSATAGLLGVDLAEFDRLASAGDPGAAGLTLIPYLDGERTPNLPDATGTLLGLRRDNMTPENLARATVLGLLCGTADALDALRAQGVAVDKVLLIGGGAQSATLQAAAADILGVPVEVPVTAEYVALGAARQAAWALAGGAEAPQWQRALARSFEPTGSGWASEIRVRYGTARGTLYGV